MWGWQAVRSRQELSPEFRQSRSAVRRLHKHRLRRRDASAELEGNRCHWLAHASARHALDLQDLQDLYCKSVPEIYLGETAFHQAPHNLTYI